MDFSLLYEKLLKAELLHQTPDLSGENKDHLSCLLEPEKHPVVIKTGSCKQSECDSNCKAACIFNAIENKNGELIINKELCTGCMECVKACKENKILPSVDIIAALKRVNDGGVSYALVAPAIIGQFKGANMGQIRNALKKLGFSGVIEVSLFADILTLKEAIEFKNHIKSKNDYMLTSCCCPVWISLIKKQFGAIKDHLIPSVSPMIAAGRFVKAISNDCTTVFIGPCVAKKAEIKESDLLGAVDYCITFKELNDAFDICGITPKNEESEIKEHSSKMGRLYAVSGGVTKAVTTTAKQLEYKNKIPIKTQRAEGVMALKSMLTELNNGKINANFYEGMGCVGGCVGGPKIIQNRQTGKINATLYANSSSFKTPINNPFVLEMFKRLQITSEEELINCSLLKREKF